MQVVEKSGDGLSKVFGVTVPAGELAKRLDEVRAIFVRSALDRLLS